MNNRIQILICLVVISTFASCVSVFKRSEQRNAERRQAFVQARPELNGDTRNHILAGEIAIGMTSEEVVASWGRPHEVNRTVGSWGVHEQWVYGYNKHYGSGVTGFISTNYLYIENGELTSWQD